MNEHTPGPWSVYHAGNVDEGEVYICQEKTGETLYQGFLVRESADENRANAQLIASAPTLLEAAQATVAVLASFKCCPWCGDVHAPFSESMVHTDTCFFPGLEAAIAQALGQEATI